MKRSVLLVIIIVITILCMFACKSINTVQMKEVTKIHDYVFDLGTYDNLDFENAEKFFKEKFDGWDGACTAVAKITDDNEMIVGRNMDLYISNKPAYVIRTNVPNKYKTIGISYSNKSGPDYEEALKNGVPEDFYKIAPFMCTDVFNEKGLYIETNMRNGEFWATGNSRYGCKGTNPGAEHRVCSLILPRYIGENCATIDEALELVKKIDIYTPNAVGMDWNFCFMMADETGHYGLLEIAQDKLSWLDKEPAQANFYLTPEFQVTEDLACGIGRYKTVMAGRDNVKNEQDMYDLIKKVSYSKIYDPDNCEFDVRTEFVAVKDYLTYDVMTSEKWKDEVYKYIKELCANYNKKTRQQKQDEGKDWESIFTEVVNCTNKTWFIRFFEDENRTIKLDFAN